MFTVSLVLTANGEIGCDKRQFINTVEARKEPRRKTKTQTTRLSGSKPARLTAFTVLFADP